MILRSVLPGGQLLAEVLPRSSLAEVVFEMRWAAVSGQFGMPTDLGYASVFDSITSYARTLGLETLTDLHPPYTGLMGTVSRRLNHSLESFPLFQIGNGLFAANQSTRYEWSAFKEFASGGASVVVGSYPKFEGFELQPELLELRYVNVFDASLVDTVQFFDFLTHATNMKISVPEGLLAGRAMGAGRLILEYPLEDVAGLAGSYSCDIKSAVRDGSPFVVLEHRVRSQGGALIATRSVKTFQRKLERWLEAAHRVVSPAFLSIMNNQAVERMK